MSAAFRKIRAAVCRRAGGSCEACGSWVGLAGEAGHADHQLGRGAGRPDASVANVWLLCVPCDARRTVNEPSATHWARLMERHALRYGFDPEPFRARMQVLQAKGLAEVSP